MRRSSLVVTLILVACSSEAKKKPMMDGAATGGTAMADAAGREGAGGSSVDAAAPGAAARDVATPDPARDMGAVGATSGPEAIVRSDAMLPGNSPFVYIASANEIRIYQLNLMNGMLVGRDAVPVMGPPGTSIAGYMTWDSKKTFMYAAHRIPNPETPIPDGGVARIAAVSAYAINKTTGGLTKVGMSVPVPNVDGATHIAIHADKYLYVANYSGNSVSAFGIGADGSVAGLIENKTMLSTGMPYRMAHQAVVTGNFLLVPCLGLNAVAQFVIDPMTGKLSDNMPATVMVPSLPLPPPDAGPADPGAGPRHLAFSADKKFAYVLNELQGSIAVFNFDPAKGTLGTVVETVLSGAPGGPREIQAAHPEVSKNNILYVSNRSTRSIGVFKIDAVSGKLNLVEHETAEGGITFPRDFTIDPTGKFLIVANERPVPGNLANILEISPMDGSLTLRQTIDIGTGSQFAGALQLP